MGDKKIGAYSYERYNLDFNRIDVYPFWNVLGTVKIKGKEIDIKTGNVMDENGKIANNKLYSPLFTCGGKTNYRVYFFPFFCDKKIKLENETALYMLRQRYTGG